MKRTKIDYLLLLGSLALKVGAEVLNRIEDNRQIKMSLIDLIEDAKKKKK